MFPVTNGIIGQPLPFTNRFPNNVSALEWVQANEIMHLVGLEEHDAVVDNDTAWRVRLGYYHASAFADEVRACVRAYVLLVRVGASVRVCVWVGVHSV